MPPQQLTDLFSKSGIPPGNTVRRTPKWQRPFRALHRSFQCSVLRLLLAEWGSFFLRIRAILQTHKQVLLPELCQRCLADYTLLLACSEDMTQLQGDHRWLGLLEVRVAAQAWVLGVETARRVSAHRISHNEENSRRRISSCPPPQETSVDSGHTSEATPAAIAGVTGNGECTRQKL